MRTFEFSDAKSKKFWNIELQGLEYTVTYGKTGTIGQTQTKSFETEAKAQAAYDKLVREKTTKGYVETTPGAGAATPTAKVLENALSADPEDVAAHSAYADFLDEQGDPRGEFIQTQLALEDASRKPAERKKLQRREKELLEAHGREWLGDLAPFLLDQSGLSDYHVRQRFQYRHQFVRGWLDQVATPELTSAFARALAKSPQARMLSKLVIEGLSYEDGDEEAEEGGDEIPEGEVALAPLRNAPLTNVRVFQLGDTPEEALEAYFSCHVGGELAVPLVKKMPRLEELYLFAHQVDTTALFKLKTLTNLRILQIYHLVSYPLELLAKNPAFANLTHLLLHPHADDLSTPTPYITNEGIEALMASKHVPKLTHLQLRLTDMGDELCALLVRSGFLKQLRVLDLRHGAITDAGADILASSPYTARLEALDLARNWLTAAGIERLTAAGVKLRADEQHNDRDDERAHLYEGDIE